jgi:hypothetical protein
VPRSIALKRAVENGVSIESLRECLATLRAIRDCVEYGKEPDLSLSLRRVTAAISEHLSSHPPEIVRIRVKPADPVVEAEAQENVVSLG